MRTATRAERKRREGKRLRGRRRRFFFLMGALVLLAGAAAGWLPPGLGELALGFGGLGFHLAPAAGGPGPASADGEPPAAPADGGPAAASSDREQQAPPGEGGPSSAPSNREPQPAPANGGAQAASRGGPGTAPPAGEPGAAPPDGKPEAAPSDAEAEPAPPAEPDLRAVPVLMYHVVSEEAGRWQELYVRPEDFRAQVEWLQAAGYEAVTLADLARAWGVGPGPVRPLPEKPVVFTFDDGYRSVYTEAFPALKAAGWPATLFLQVNMLDTAGGLTEEMVKEMQEAGFEVASHTLTHPDLTKVDAERLRQELVDSRAELESRFGATVQALAYPSGRFNEEVVAAATDAGYLLAVTTKPGISRPEEPYALHRVRIDRSDGEEGLVRRLAAWR